MPNRPTRRAWLKGATALIPGSALLRASPAAWAEPDPVAQHGIAMIGAPALPAGFERLPYTSPSARPGGRLRLGQLDSFDSLNPFIIKGTSPTGVRDFVYESLMVRSLAEPFTLYGLIARSVEMPPDRHRITFNLDPRARFADGVAITSRDVLHSRDLILERAWPFMQATYRQVVRATADGPHRVTFELENGENRELPLLLALMPVLPRHLLTPERFASTWLEPPTGSGPYRVGALDPGRSLTYERDEHYWGRDLPIGRGRHNFGQVRIDFFRDGNSLFESFIAQDLDVRIEEDPTRWAEAYDIAPVRDGRILRAEFKSQQPAGLSALVFNCRHPLLANPDVRRALSLAFDGPSMNRELFHGLFARTESVFPRSEFAASGRPLSLRERDLLAPFEAELPPEIFSGPPTGPIPAGSRQALALASRLLDGAGLVLRGTQRVEASTGRPVTLEFLAESRTQERVMLTYTRNVERLGIATTIRLIDDAQYWSRLKSHEFAVIQWTWAGSASPGNEQLNRWGSAAADKPGTQNFTGLKSRAVDAMIQAMLKAESRDDYVAAARAFDRIVMAGNFIIPLFHPPSAWVAYSSRLRHPDAAPLPGYDLTSWWDGEA